MTLQNAKKYLEIEKKKGNTKLVEMWKSRIARKERHPKYAHLIKEKTDGKKRT